MVFKFTISVINSVSVNSMRDPRPPPGPVSRGWQGIMGRAMHGGALEGKLFQPVRDSCIAVINIVSPNGLGWKPEGVAAAETWSSPPLWLLTSAQDDIHPSLFSRLALLCATQGSSQRPF